MKRKARRRTIALAQCVMASVILVSTKHIRADGDEHQGKWTPLANLAPHPAGTMILLTDGTIMAFGGGSGNGPIDHWMRLTPDAHGSYVNGTWTNLASMNLGRLYFASNMLTSGKVWVLGGEYCGPVVHVCLTNLGEMFDPVANTWSPIAHHPEARFGDDPSMLLPGGKILAGSISSRNTWLYDIATDTWAAAPLPKHYNDRSDEEGWAKLKDGTVVTYDIFQSVGTGQGYAERFTPGTNTWSGISPADGTANGSLAVLSSRAVGFELGPVIRSSRDGRLFVIGANSHTALYTPSTNTWAPGPDIVGLLNGAPAFFGADDAPAAELPNGDIIFAADAGPTLGVFKAPTEFFVFNPKIDTISLLSPAPPDPGLPHNPSFIYRLLMLPNGQLLMTNSSNQLYVFTPGEDDHPIDRPEIRQVTYDGGGVYTLTGRDLNGQSAGSAYGDDVESDENYPIVRLRTSDDDDNPKVIYGRTTNWSNVGVDPGLETVKFTLPVNAGNFDLLVSGAGISSEPVKFNVEVCREGPPHPCLHHDDDQ